MLENIYEKSSHPELVLQFIPLKMLEMSCIHCYIASRILEKLCWKGILALLFYSFEFMTDFFNIFANFGKAFFRQLCLTAVS